MRIKGLDAIFKKEFHPFINDILNNEDFFIIRQNADRLAEYTEQEFALNFDYAIAKSDVLPVDIKDPITGEWIEDATEYVFLYYIYFITTRTHLILEDYMEHCDDIGKKISDTLSDHYEANMVKSQFVHLKLKRATSLKELKNIKKTVKTLQKPIKKTTKATIEGKILNNSERFQIINQSIGLWKIIDRKDISQLKKYKLLALVLGINEDNARKLVANNYDSKDRPELIEKFLKQLE